jgi:hypothetical protein
MKVRGMDRQSSAKRAMRIPALWWSGAAKGFGVRRLAQFACTKKSLRLVICAQMRAP